MKSFTVRLSAILTLLLAAVFTAPSVHAEDPDYWPHEEWDCWNLTSETQCSFGANCVWLETECAYFDKALTSDLHCTFFECGDGNCDPDEDFYSCSLDCAEMCGDGVCDGSEDGGTCPADCHESGDGYCTVYEVGGGDCLIPAVCGDMICDSGEDSSSCEDDCPEYCGNYICDGAEDAVSCPGDCATGPCGDGVCSDTEDKMILCPEDCGGECGDGVCDIDEDDNGTCPQDCSEFCGDNVCEGSEDDASCPDDCAECGDSNVSSGEDCDDGGESAACNADCTFAACGDGVFNSTAGETCDDGNTSNGDGCDDQCQPEPVPPLVCIPPNDCGNLIIEGIEDCDDGAVDTPSCNADCTFNVCGDNYLNTATEFCDDGNTTNGDGCDEYCNIESPPVCGDWNTDAGEDCDEGAADTSVCDYDCSYNVCGDSYINYTTETCDDGNTLDGDGCDAYCQIETTPVCGDWSIDTGEECDEGAVDTSSCDYDCSMPICGDGYLNTFAGEACDDGNTDPHDGCDPYCQIETTPVCGNWSIEAGEDCDEGGVETPTCNADCTMPVCGDGYHNASAGEECDDGNTNDGDGCDSFCYIETTPVCGDFVTEGSEECDEGGVDTGTCDMDCTIPSCGDSHLNTAYGEQCDDGNTTDGDGCDMYCIIEAPSEVCGNGVLEGTEICDDGNTVNGDGCDEFCNLES